ncbi:hypothetical protein [Paenibacillus methanolicus]|uniref:WD40 repeat protein n=1 Tax=Paenibacillus methanolicus TaxID=582686 RepID=A0A5S5BMJ9_9BACL|nr:hypothetical protein [Paenibacillus methanolicus]TYP67392.1 hypothetical protein BCM02_12410 [Paenibacillus methanolicus]
MEKGFFKIERKSIKLFDEELLDIYPLLAKENTYVAITKNKKIIELDTMQESCNDLFALESEEIEINFDEAISILASSDSNIIAVFNTYGRFGLVIDLSVKQIVMQFSRDDYHFNQTIFPVSFYTRNNQILLIHGTKWNRVDISNPFTGEVLTSREDPEFRMINNKPECDDHYLDYFHGQLLVSPNNEWVVSNGWEWHPYGSVTVWNMNQWIANNCWESEDGDSKKELWRYKEEWNDPICWLSNTTVGILGKNDSNFCDDEINMPTGNLFRVYDVCNGVLLNEFEITYGQLIFDTFLYCSSKDTGLRVYNISKGEVLFEDHAIYPQAYHSTSKEFLEVNTNQLSIVKLIEN